MRENSIYRYPSRKTRSNFRWDFFSIFDVRLRSWIKFLYSNKSRTTFLCDFRQLTLIGIFGIHWKLEWPCTNKSTFSHHILISDFFFVGTISTVCLVPFPAFSGHLNIDTYMYTYKNGWRHASYFIFQCQLIQSRPTFWASITMICIRFPWSLHEVSPVNVWPWPHVVLLFPSVFQ